MITTQNNPAAGNFQLNLAFNLWFIDFRSDWDGPEMTISKIKAPVREHRDFYIILTLPGFQYQE